MAKSRGRDDAESASGEDHTDPLRSIEKAARATG